MDRPTGEFQARTISVRTHSQSIARLLEVLMLLALGVVAIALHARFKSPLSIPGHHGLEFMALLMLGRLSSNMKYASSLSSLGMGVFLLFPFVGFSDPMMGYNYMLPGFMLDLSYRWLGSSRFKLLLLAIFAGFSYMLVPLSRLLVNLTTGYQYGAFLKHGFVLPFVSWFFFGLAGGLLGTGISKTLTRFLSKLSK